MATFDKGSSLGFIGAGKVGGTLAITLANAGYSVKGVANRTYSSAQELAARIDGCEAHPSYQGLIDACEVVFITTSDGAIGQIVAAGEWRRGQAVVHCSGAASLDVLDKSSESGALPGAFHPFQAFSSVENGIKSIPGITFGIEGDDAMRTYLGEMARNIGANPIFLNAEDKVLYHLSGVLMGNLLTCLAAIAAQVWEKFDYDRADGVKALVPMMRAVANNLETSGIPDAVAGPYPRGDVGTVRKHLEVLEARFPEILPMYCELALAGLPYAIEKGLDQSTADEISTLIVGFKN